MISIDGPGINNRQGRFKVYVGGRNLKAGTSLGDQNTGPYHRLKTVYEHQRSALGREAMDLCPFCVTIAVLAAAPWNRVQHVGAPSLCLD